MFTVRRGFTEITLGGNFCRSIVSESICVENALKVCLIVLLLYKLSLNIIMILGVDNYRKLSKARVARSAEKKNRTPSPALVEKFTSQRNYTILTI